MNFERFARDVLPLAGARPVLVPAAGLIRPEVRFAKRLIENAALHTALEPELDGAARAAASHLLDNKRAWGPHY